MATSDKDKWQFHIPNIDAGHTISLKIHKNKTVADLWENYRAKGAVYHQPSSDKFDFSFLTPDGIELKENDQRRLVDVGVLRNGCNLRLVVSVHGGGCQPKLEVTQQVQNPTTVPPLAGRITNSHPDMMELDEGSRGRMSPASSTGAVCNWPIRKPAKFGENYFSRRQRYLEGPTKDVSLMLMSSVKVKRKTNALQ